MRKLAIMVAANMFATVIFEVAAAPIPHQSSGFGRAAPPGAADVAAVTADTALEKVPEFFASMYRLFQLSEPTVDRVKNLFKKASEWFESVTGIGFRDITDGLAGLLLWALESLMDLIEWAAQWIVDLAKSSWGWFRDAFYREITIEGN